MIALSEGKLAKPAVSLFHQKFAKARGGLSLLSVFLLLPLLMAAQADSESSVHAVLFYSPTCPHCHSVINEFLIPLNETYGDQLNIIGIDTTHAVGSTLYLNMIDRFAVPETRTGVPALVVGDTLLVGSAEIPEKFPGIVEDGLAAGGIDWPDIPGLAEYLPDPAPTADPDTVNTPSLSTADSVAGNSSSETTSTGDAVPQGNQEASSARSLQDASSDTAQTTPAEAPPADPAGFTLAWLVLIAMILALLYSLRQIALSRPLRFSPAITTWLVPLLALAGLGVALYLAYVEITHVQAVCGPVGECNIVQSSSYARLLGIPVAVLGVFNYLAIIALWAGVRLLPPRWASWCAAGLLLLAVLGTLFSIYLTLLELFAIGAVCAWCLSSAVITMLLMIMFARSISQASLKADLAPQT